MFRICRYSERFAVPLEIRHDQSSPYYIFVKRAKLFGPMFFCLPNKHAVSQSRIAGRFKIVVDTDGKKIRDRFI